MFLVRACMGSALTAAVLVGQTTWVVDVQGSGHFTDLPAAIAAAAPGDTLLVLPGRYTPASVNKGIAIVGGVGCELRAQPFFVRDLPLGQLFTITGFNDAPGSPATDFVIERCAGRVHLQKLDSTTVFPQFGYLAGSLRIVDCQAVSVHECGFYGGPGAELIRSSAAFTNSRMVGQDWSSGAESGLDAVDSRIEFANCSFQGGDGLRALGQYQPGAEGVRLSGCELLGASGQLAGGVYAGMMPTWEEGLRILGGRAVLDPLVTTTVDPTSTGVVQVTRTPGLTAPSPPVGQLVVAEWSGGGGLPGVVLASLVGPRFASPWGPFWLDIPTSIVIYAGPASGTASLALGSLFVPGTSVTLQGAVIDGNVLLLTNGQTVTVR
jgi:hypothetical protein